MSEDARAHRLAENESTYRRVNERVEELADELELTPEFVCECGRDSCSERLALPVREYERVRAHGRRFLVASGHERPEVEKVIDEWPGWLIVEKIGGAGEAAAEQDPRGGD
jgi:hypothetical protein